MPANTKQYTRQSAIVEHRRRLVAQMRVRGMSMREIVAGLDKMLVRNPRTEKGWSLPVIQGDCAALSEQWRAEALEDTTEVKAHLWAEIREVRRRAWADNDYALVLRAIAQESALLGLDGQQTDDAMDAIRAIADANGLDPARMVETAEEIMKAHRELFGPVKRGR